MAAFVSTTPLLTRPGFAGAAVARSPPSVAATVTMETAKSEAMPFMKKPEGLIPSQDGYTGFDPFFMSNWLDQEWAAKGEVKNGRVAMLACVGWWIAEFVHLPDARFQNPVALDAALDIPRGLWAPIIISVSLVEILTFPQMLDSNRRAGDLDFDPLKLDSPKNRLSEVKHGRLAMLAILTMVIQQSNNHKPTLSALFGKV
ncbi:hypothetical protein BU14_0359s0001 [Porphyra umbilicalis]|uniref:Chlorophyll a-b binding protein, chloroplastic n=1 Tax=Porphyra umbilicalis TaxID=2786 RepID=A0A1X6NXE9_PORUM|nr:hypothetical protein BU14_0359s0001 [Porphyra umbilicalis]OSX73294.1 hypothetical protein BU14_0359s0001 [Porphyra umbilicalis]|eukprot:OSX73293.1 hypothetical protein BU14_0359s0001 [Porphyra umbilicalis]